MRRALTNQLYPEWTIKVKVNYLTDEEARALHGFVAKLKGALTPFYWLDSEDYQVKASDADGRLRGAGQLCGQSMCICG